MPNDDIATPIELLREFDYQWGELFDADDDVNGADAVDWIGEFLPRVRATLAKERA